MELYNCFNEKINKYPIIINLPHSGTYIPINISQKFITPHPIIANNDWFLQNLYDFLKDMKLTILEANYSRYVVDLNRIITTPLIGDDYNKYTIYSKTTWKKELYKTIPSHSECEERIKKYYIPYHNKLKELIEFKKQKFDKILLLDLHSGYSSTGEKDICLGNANGKMSDDTTISKLQKILEKERYSVNINTPCTGGKVLRKYHEENKNLECILFELNYKNYIKKEYSGEEEIKTYNIELFQQTQKKLKRVFKNFLKEKI